MYADEVTQWEIEMVAKDHFRVFLYDRTGRKGSLGSSASLEQARREVGYFLGSRAAEVKGVLPAAWVLADS